MSRRPFATTPLPKPAAPHATRDEAGFALMLAILATLIISTLALTAVTVGGNAGLIAAYEERQNLLEAVADAGLEEGRARINADSDLYPAEGFTALENGVPARQGDGEPIAGVKRYLYAGPIGTTTGQHGVMGAIVSIAEAANGDRVVRRLNVAQESFARYAYFTEVEPNLYFALGDRVQGPVHSNDIIRVHSTGATFAGPGMVTTHRTIQGRQHGTFLEGFQEHVARIPLPPTAELDKLQQLAAQGGTGFTAPASSANGARMRVEFVTVGGEGFFRVYYSEDREDWVMATPHATNADWGNSDYCGEHSATPMTAENFVPASRMGGTQAQRLDRIRSPLGRCYLGGDEALNTPAGNFHHSPPPGGPASSSGWVRRNWALTGTPPAPFSSRPDRDYLFPLNRQYNPEFKGVIHVNGNVALNGTVRGRVTLVATGSIYVVDDVLYNTAPGAAPSCADEAGGDMLGIFSGQNVWVANNARNSPSRVAGTWVSLGSTHAETIHGVILALGQFGAQDPMASQPTGAQPCDGANHSRGCLYMAGGIIQHQRGAVGVMDGRGYRKRYSYDSCAAQNPPPYFPTTGRFSRSTLYEVDPHGFDVAQYFERFSAQ